ncbi:hypothetical protein [uncultured Arthrobacter sp.]|uniref:hypothetical protein n=1 Tax=uncultured Arthrobacter sp. TaxID=114050 RepID=UPI0032169E55
MTKTTTATPVIQVNTSNIERHPKQPCQWTKDPQWIADHAIELATARVLEDWKKIGAANAS